MEHMIVTARHRMQNTDTFYTGNTSCSWFLSSPNSATLRYSFAVDMSRVGPGARLRISDASAGGDNADADSSRVYEGFSSATDNSLLLAARQVLVTFEADPAARAAAGPRVTVQALQPEEGMSADTVRRIIFAGTFTLIGVYIVSAIIAWKRYKVLDGRRQDTEREAARRAAPPMHGIMHVHRRSGAARLPCRFSTHSQSVEGRDVRCCVRCC